MLICRRWASIKAAEVVVNGVAMPFRPIPSPKERIVVHLVPMKGVGGSGVRGCVEESVTPILEGPFSVMSTPNFAIKLHVPAFLESFKDRHAPAPLQV